MFLKIKSGRIISSSVALSSDDKLAEKEIKRFRRALEDRSIEDIRDFVDILSEADECPSVGLDGISRWLNDMFGKTGRSRHTARSGEGC